MYGERRGMYRGFVGKPEEKRPLGRPKHRWEHNIKMDLQAVGCVLWTGASWFRIALVAGTCERSNEPLDSIKSGEFLDWLQTG